MQRTGGDGNLFFAAGCAPAADRPHVIPPMHTFRFITMLLLGVLSAVSVPAGLLFGLLGLSGRFIDSSYRENVEAGVTWMAIGFAPLVPLLLYGYLGRSRKQPQGFPVVEKPADQRRDNPPMQRTATAGAGAVE